MYKYANSARNSVSTELKRSLYWPYFLRTIDYFQESDYIWEFVRRTSDIQIDKEEMKPTKFLTKLMC